MNNFETIDKLCSLHTADENELERLIAANDEELEYLRRRAESVTKEMFGGKIYIRGLIEISSFCKNDCLYCGLRHSNRNAARYRLDKSTILACCAEGYTLGFRTFVLQGGEDPHYTDEVMCDIISSIKSRFPDCAVTLSLGERSKKSYERMFESGADRYLLRHETADALHYGKLHPAEMSFENRVRCLYDLKEIGWQTGAGFMVGSPFQTSEMVVGDLKFIEKLDPQMCGIGPFIPHRDTPFKNKKSGSVRLTLTLLSIIRLMKPSILLPATTALATLDKKGRENGVLHGANVVMPNLTPANHRKDYSLYDNKVCFGTEAAQNILSLDRSMKEIGYNIVIDKGDFISPQSAASGAS